MDEPGVEMETVFEQEVGCDEGVKVDATVFSDGDKMVMLFAWNNDYRISNEDDEAEEWLPIGLSVDGARSLRDALDAALAALENATPPSPPSP